VPKDDFQIYHIIGSNSEDPRQPPELMPGFDDNFSPVVGRIVGHWSMLEQETDVLVWALLRNAEKNQAGWKRWGFSQRWKLLQTEWQSFAAEHDELIGEMAGIAKSVSICKVVRDHIAHTRVTYSMNDRGAFVRFQTGNRSFPWSKRYHLPDLDAVSLRLSNAVGQLFRLTNLQFSQFFKPESLALLSTLPDTQKTRYPEI
jgi:hypothetical protein